MNQEFFTYLPSELIINILSRLPLRTIISCKCVCKSWLNLLDTPEFAKSHLSISVPGLILYESRGHLEYLEVFEFEDELDLEAHELHYNPVTEISSREFINEDILLPTPGTIWHYPTIVSYGFGASKTSGQHKVVRIYHECRRDTNTHKLLGIPKSECWVYTLGTGSWRTISPGPKLEYNCRSIGAFLNGSLHWLVTDLEGSNRISCLDLETEVFSTFAPPPALPGSRRFLWGLMVLGDHLCICDNSSDDEIVIWLMKEYGVEKSWTKEFVISKLPDYAGNATRPMMGKVVQMLEGIVETDRPPAAKPATEGSVGGTSVTASSITASVLSLPFQLQCQCHLRHHPSTLLEFHLLPPGSMGNEHRLDYYTPRQSDLIMPTRIG
ncbi:UNVERIFIED_CONTAM: putative F-box protein [Sesamum radiatum]|uniref:F-box protein n=1 Tax=Sesamum radiatum TaxID=300843 RepID=A0AAW2M550_SESRA